jgi:hypothetical protein
LHSQVSKRLGMTKTTITSRLANGRGAWKTSEHLATLPGSFGRSIYGFLVPVLLPIGALHTNLQQADCTFTMVLHQLCGVQRQETILKEEQERRHQHETERLTPRKLRDARSNVLKRRDALEALEARSKAPRSPFEEERRRKMEEEKARREEEEKTRELEEERNRVRRKSLRYYDFVQLLSCFGGAVYFLTMCDM